MREVREFSWAALPSWRRAEVHQIRAIVRRIGPSARSDLLGARWASLLGAPLDAAPEVPFVLTRVAALQAYERVSVAAVMHHPPFGVALALCDRRGALRLAARALGADDESSRRAAADNVFTQAHEGALAALCSRAVALAVAPSPVPSLRAVTEHVSDALDALADDELVAWPWRVALGDDAVRVTFVACVRGLMAPAPEALSLRRWASLEVTCTVLAAREAMSARTVAGLSVGDALVLDSLAWRGGALAGTVTVALGDVALTASIEGRREVKITSEMSSKGEPMTEPEERTDVTAVRTEALASLPVEVAVEIARTTVPVGEIAQWRVGEVIALGARLGERVTVRAGGRTVARGELVDVEGEVGVRITEIV